MNYAASTSTKGGAAYLGKDILGSIRSVSNSQAGLEDRYEYDAFGKPYKGDLENGMSLGYTGKPYDSATGMYNYGYRDYKPENARFTTVDPVRDGANWFAYVNNDPVNYFDPTGLSGEDVQKSSPKELIQISFGVRGAIILGGEVNVGIVINPNNLWDSGITLGAGIGVGFEVGVDTPINNVVESAIGAAVGMVDFTKPTHTSEIEGVGTKYVASAGAGISSDGKQITGVEVGSIGGGAYKTVKTAITAGEVVETIVNTPRRIENAIYDFFNTPKQLPLLELDGQ
jgi:RHS repeat-associated protein